MKIHKTTEIQQLRENLIRGSREERLLALSALDSNSTLQLLAEVIALTNHWRAEIKVAALHALRDVDAALITEVIAESLHDENADVRAAASELFHRSTRRLAA